ncbi:MAG: hypothetical protein K2Q22_01215, partial [Cytophagales bacterium]|nr:hypothetical protein [Cytophagales bacterium]
MEAKDLIIGPIYFFIIYVVGYIVRNRTCKDRQIKAYFMPGLMMKLLGAISLGLIYQFYYGSGDTFSYFLYGSKYIYNAFEESPFIALKMIFGNPAEYDMETAPFMAGMLYKYDPHSYFVIRVSGLLGLFTFHSYAANALLFAVISFSGAWLMFLTFYEIYPNLHRKFAIAIFFTPSVFFWGSGLLKDSITFGALGWLFYSIQRILAHKDFSFSNLASLIISTYVIQLVKVYILLCFLPAVLIWTFLIYNDKIKSTITRTLMKPIMLLFAVAMGLFTGNFVTKDNERY